MSCAYIGVPLPEVVFVIVDDRADFDKIGLPCTDRGPQANGNHVLTKDVAHDGVMVIFQHWLSFNPLGTDTATKGGVA